jgi:hypothetical protein
MSYREKRDKRNDDMADLGLNGLMMLKDIHAGRDVNKE